MRVKELLAAAKAARYRAEVALTKGTLRLDGEGVAREFRAAPGAVGLREDRDLLPLADWLKEADQDGEIAVKVLHKNRKKPTLRLMVHAGHFDLQFEKGSSGRLERNAGLAGGGKVEAHFEVPRKDFERAVARARPFVAKERLHFALQALSVQDFDREHRCHGKGVHLIATDGRALLMQPLGEARSLGDGKSVLFIPPGRDDLRCLKGAGSVSIRHRGGWTELGAGAFRLRHEMEVSYPDVERVIWAEDPYVRVEVEPPLPHEIEALTEQDKKNILGGQEARVAWLYADPDGRCGFWREGDSPEDSPAVEAKLVGEAPPHPFVSQFDIKYLLPLMKGARTTWSLKYATKRVDGPKGRAATKPVIVEYAGRKVRSSDRCALADLPGGAFAAVMPIVISK